VEAITSEENDTLFDAETKSVEVEEIEDIDEIGNWYRLSFRAESFFDSAQEVVVFFNDNLKEDLDITDMVYGSSQDAVLEAEASDSTAMYGTGELAGEWAVNAYKLLEEKVGSREEDVFEESIENIAAMTMASVSLSRDDPESRHGFGFYADFVDGFTSVTGQQVEEETGPVVIDVEDEDVEDEYEEPDTSITHEVEGEVVKASDKEERSSVEEYEEDEESEGYEDQGEFVRETEPRDERFTEEQESEGDFVRGMDALEEDYESEGSYDISEILSKNVPEAKERVEELEDPDYEALLESEKEGQDRVTLTRYLEEKMEENEGGF